MDILSTIASDINSKFNLNNNDEEINEIRGQDANEDHEYDGKIDVLHHVLSNTYIISQFQKDKDLVFDSLDEFKEWCRSLYSNFGATAWCKR